MHQSHEQSDCRSEEIYIKITNSEQLTVNNNGFTGINYCRITIVSKYTILLLLVISC